MLAHASYGRDRSGAEYLARIVADPLASVAKSPEGLIKLNSLRKAYGK